MMRQSLQAVLPESTGNKTSSLRESVCRRSPSLFLVLPIRRYRSLLVSGMPEWQGHNQSDKLLQSWYCRQLRSALLFHEPRIAALQVNLKEAYCYELAISLEMMLYHDDEPLTFDLGLASHDRRCRDTRKTYRVRSQLVGGSDCCFQGRKPGWTGTELINPHGEQSCCLLISPAISPHITGISLLRPA